MKELKDFIEWIQDRKEFKICRFIDTGSEYDSYYEPVKESEVLEIYKKKSEVEGALNRFIKNEYDTSDLTFLREAYKKGLFKIEV